MYLSDSTLSDTFTWIKRYFFTYWFLYSLPDTINSQEENSYHISVKMCIFHLLSFCRSWRAYPQFQNWQNQLSVNGNKSYFAVVGQNPDLDRQWAQFKNIKHNDMVLVVRRDPHPRTLAFTDKFRIKKFFIFNVIYYLGVEVRVSEGGGG
jgi:hypothetical protein